MNAPPTSLLQRLLERPVPFALSYRSGSNDPGLLDVIHDETPELYGLVGLPLDEPGPDLPRHDPLALIPCRQIAERGLEALDDGTPLLALKVLEQELLPLEQALALLPNQALELSGEGFDLSDEAYAEVIGRVIADGIGRGEDTNLMVKRRLQTCINGHATANALSFFHRLLLREKGAYWTLIAHTDECTLADASLGRYISVRDGLAVINLISDIYRCPPAGPDLTEVMESLDDRKKAGELYMVVNEELKAMTWIYEGGGRVFGPYLKEIAHLVHIEYFTEGQTSRDVREVPRKTLFALAVTDSPLGSACQVTRHYEP